MELYSENTIDFFIKVTKYDFITFLSNCVYFFDNQKQDIYDYYNGETKNPNLESFSELNRLIKESSKVLELFQAHKSKFKDHSYWNLLEQVEEINIKLQTIDNTYFYSQSSITKNNFNPGIKKELKLSQHQTIEKVNRNNVDEINWDNSWVDLSLKNDFREEDYTPNGGKLLSANFGLGDIDTIESVLGNLEGEQINGKDLSQTIEFINSDLKVLSPRETIRQSISIMANLNINDNPQFPDEGIQKSLFVGNNLAGLQYPILFRQLSEIFASDDTISSFEITDLKIEQDTLQLFYTIQTKYGENLEQIMSI